MAQTLDDFLTNVLTQDVRKRTACHADLVPYLQNPRSSLYCEETEKFVDGISSWISSSNYKISLNGLEVTALLIDRMGDHFRSHVTTVLPAVIDRLGDNKDQVRENARDVFLKLMSPTNPQYVFERSMTAFSHKLWRVREEICICLVGALNSYGAKSLSLSKLVAAITKLLEDQSIPVRDAAIEALVEVYRHVGERVRQDLMKKDINRQKMQILIQKMDEVKENGQMIAESKSQDDVDFAKPVGVPKTAVKRSGSAAGTSGASSATGLARRGSAVSNKQSAGSVDEDAFTNSFEDVPKIHLFSAKELNDHVTKINTMLSDGNNPWEKRNESLKLIRSLIVAGALDIEDFTVHLRTLESALVLSVKDLRSQIVREACVTISYLAQSLGNKFDKCAEQLLPALIVLLMNSAKIMATSGRVSIKFIVQHTHAPRLIPIITQHLGSKSAVTRRECGEFLCLLLNTWPTHTLERHIAILQDAIKKGIGDADAETRQHSRKAYWGFAEHFKSQADALFESLDFAKQKQLQGEMSSSSSNQSLERQVRAASAGAASAAAKNKSRSRSMSTERGTNLFSRTLSGRRSVAPGAKQHTDHTDAPPSRPTTASRVAAVPSSRKSHMMSSSSSNGGIMRSSSAIDLANNGSNGAAGGTLPKSRIGANVSSAYGSSTYNSLPRPRKSASNRVAVENVLSPERSRPKSKIGVSQSQPSSRSTSPSSRLSYLTHQQQQALAPARTAPGPARRSGIPRSQGASRETSPNRLYGRERKMSGSSLRYGMPRQKAGAQPLAQRVLTQGQEVEQAVADALLAPHQPPTQRVMKKRYESYESDDANSETSSVCSERSYTSYGRTSEDIQEILSNMTSGSWADRKEGLICLQNMMRGGRPLNRMELKKITEVFTRMFHDPHGKVFSMFLETMIDLLAVHKQDLHDWLYICLTRLLHKLGADMLGSLHTKVQRALDAVRDSFPYHLQFNILTRFIVDSTQTPNLKVKVALLNYIHSLTMVMDAAEFSNSSDTRLAVSRIITWTTEPKSVEVRKASQAVLIALFNLNTPEFSMMLQVLPKTFQDGATKILHNHLRTNSETEPLSPRNITSPTTPSRYKMSPNRPTAPMDDVDTENMNPEEIYNSIKKTSADIQNLSKLDSQYDDLKKERDSTSQDSGIQGSMHDVRALSPDSKDSPGGARRPPHYNPQYYQEDAMNGYNKSAIGGAVFDMENDLFNEEFPGDFADVVSEILSELSNHNERPEERKNAMLQLIKLTREGCHDVWDEHFKTILLLLLETLGDIDDHIRALALRVLREILRHQPQRFKDYAELTILKILEAHKDTSKEVTRAAEECASTLAGAIPPEQCLRVLMPIINTADYPVNLAAIKMETKVIENVSRSSLEPLLPEVIPGLVQGYDNNESPVRKAAVFCLVAIYMVIGEEMRPYIQDLSGSKMKLLNLYIKRAQSQSTSAATSKTTSPTASTIADLNS